MRFDKENIEQKLNALADRFSFSRVMGRKKDAPLSPTGRRYASFDRRMVAITIDTVILTLLLWPFNDWLTAQAYSHMVNDQAVLEGVIPKGATEEEAQIAMMRYMLTEGGMVEAMVFLFQVQFGVLAVYSVGFWHWWKGATPGKKLLKLRVVDAKTDAPLSDWQAVFRIGGYLLAGLPFLIGILSIQWNKQRRGWHDLFAGTAVIIDR